MTHDREGSILRRAIGFNELLLGRTLNLESVRLDEIHSPLVPARLPLGRLLAVVVVVRHGDCFRSLIFLSQGKQVAESVEECGKKEEKKGKLRVKIKRSEPLV